jgi:tetratricopeptide (TPR) repeat protein
MLLVFSLVVLSTNAAFGQRVGDSVVVIENCEIKSGEAATDQAFPGIILKVNAIKGKSLWVSNGIPGWIQSENTVPVEDAIAYFSDQIRHNPTAAHYGARGFVWYGKKQFDSAISDSAQAIRLNPKGAAFYELRGLCLLAKERWDGAIADFDEAIRLGPTFRTYTHRGSAWAGKRDYRQASADFDEAIRLEPRFAFSYNSAAWLRATCPDAKYRDAQRAISEATTACKLENWKRASSLGTLAAAYAEAGDFKEAVKWEEKALEQATESDREEWRPRLNLYRSGKPFRDTPLE